MGLTRTLILMGQVKYGKVTRDLWKPSKTGHAFIRSRGQNGIKYHGCSGCSMQPREDAIAGDKMSMWWFILTGAGVNRRTVPSLSQPEAWFTHTPGLKVGLIPRSRTMQMQRLRPQHPSRIPIRSCSSNEQGASYRSCPGRVPGRLLHPSRSERQSRPRRKRCHHCELHGLAASTWAPEHPRSASRDPLADLIDSGARSLPWRGKWVMESVRKTGKALGVPRRTRHRRVIPGIASHISEPCFESLDAPVVRLASLDNWFP